jgi:hypothetical protein
MGFIKINFIAELNKAFNTGVAGKRVEIRVLSYA